MPAGERHRPVPSKKLIPNLYRIPSVFLPFDTFGRENLLQRILFKEHKRRWGELRASTPRRRSIGRVNKTHTQKKRGRTSPSGISSLVIQCRHSSRRLFAGKETVDRARRPRRESVWLKNIYDTHCSVVVEAKKIERCSRSASPCQEGDVICRRRE